MVVHHLCRYRLECAWRDTASATERSVRGCPPPVPLPKQSEQCVWKSTCGATMCEHDTPREGQQTHLKSRMICVTRLPAGFFFYYSRGMPTVIHVKRGRLL